MDYSLPGLTWLIRLRIGICHLSILGIVVHGSCYISHCFQFSVVVVSVAVVSLCLFFLFFFLFFRSLFVCFLTVVSTTKSISFPSHITFNILLNFFIITIIITISNYKTIKLCYITLYYIILFYIIILY